MKKTKHKDISKVVAFAPATSANFAAGFDLMGFAINGVGDRVCLKRRQDEQIIIKNISGVIGKTELPMDLDKNICSAVILKLIKDKRLTIGLDIYIEKGIAIGSGMGGSAASAVAALMAINQFLEKPLSKLELVEYSLFGEYLATGGREHADNIIPCLFGGLTLLNNIKPCKFISLPGNDLLACIVLPDIRIDTSDSREVLPKNYPLADIVLQQSNLAGIISSLYTQDIDLLQESFEDILIEPFRKKLIIGYDDVKKAAFSSGALGFGISGSGPAVFALLNNKQKSKAISDSMVDAFALHGHAAKAYITSLNELGAKVELIEHMIPK